MSKYKVLVVASHPTPYSVSFWRLMAENAELDLLVAYLSMQGVEKTMDESFGVELVWDVPLLDGYKWIHLPNKSPQPGLGKFFGLINPQLWELIAKENFDVIMCYSGYAYASFWLLVAACKKFKVPFIFSTDASNIKPRSGSWKLKIKKVILPLLFNLAQVIIVSSTPGKKMVASVGFPENRIVITPSVVDNDWWSEQANQVNPDDVKQKLGIPLSAFIILYVAKLQPWKRPEDLLIAFSKLTEKNSYLLFAGDGILKENLLLKAEELDIKNRVIFLGFVNQSQLPAIYKSTDVFVLPSEYEPFGVVVNEAMVCGCVPVTSDRVGAHYDLIKDGENGFVYPCGNTDALGNILNNIFADSKKLNKMKQAAIKRMETWSPRDNVEAVIKAIKKAINS